LKLKKNKKYGYATRKVPIISNFEAVARGLNIFFSNLFFARMFFSIFGIADMKADQNKKIFIHFGAPYAATLDIRSSRPV